jgi:predicted HTH domain antitoxin
MPIHYDVTKDLRYLQGVETKTKEVIINLLNFGKLSIKEIAELTKVDLDTVIKISTEINGK